MNMTKKQFRHDMRRGLGSCQLGLRRCTDIEEYRQDILCRLCLLELVQPRGLLTPELIEECRWDCYMEIREFVDKLYKLYPAEWTPIV